ncbi:hypothetical protein LJC56_03075 [Christensenellaceae bacterium OttesenSCG-928-K19]|nr:hypothetical protein [Christensenellaceae bacterium OttesenSCG-928-K19]
MGSIAQEGESIVRAKLTTPERQYVSLRYVTGFSASEVARRMDYSEDHTRKIKKRALDKITALER